MSKKELEFTDCETAFAWQPVPGEAQGVVEKILSRDPEKTGDYTRLLRFPAGFAGAEVLTHSFWEEVYIIEGSLLDIRTGQVFSKGYYACRPPGMVHGPYRAPEGCMTFETRYNKAGSRM
jgi:hypothetical protein